MTSSPWKFGSQRHLFRPCAACLYPFIVFLSLQVYVSLITLLGLRPSRIVCLRTGLRTLPPTVAATELPYVHKNQRLSSLHVANSSNGWFSFHFDNALAAVSNRPTAFL